MEEKDRPVIEHPNDAIVRVTRAAICDSTCTSITGTGAVADRPDQRDRPVGRLTGPRLLELGRGDGRPPRPPTEPVGRRVPGGPGSGRSDAGSPSA
jgi:hypothetical protein